MKKKSQKRALTLLLCAALVLALLSGCGGSTSGTTSAADSGSTASAESSAATAPETSEPVQADDNAAVEESAAEPGEETAGVNPALRLDESYQVAAAVPVSLPLTEEEKTFSWFMKGSDALGTVIQSVDENCSVQVFREQTNVRFEYIAPSFDTASEQFNILIASGTFPDVNNGVYNYYTSGLDSAIDEGIIMDLSDLVYEYAPNYTRFLDAFPNIERDDRTDTGRIWGFASIGVDSPLQWGPMVRQDWLDETGLDVPVTVEDWENLLVAFQENGHSNALLLHENGFVCFFGAEGAISSAYNISPLGNESTNAFFNVDGVLHYSPIEEGYRDYLALMSDWYSRDLVYKDFTSAGMGNTRDIIADSSVGLFVWNAQDIGGVSSTIGIDGCVSPIALPVLDSSNPESHFYNFTQPVTNGLCIGGNVDDADLPVLLSWFNYLYSDDGAIISNYGREGETFEFDENNMPQFTEMIYNNTGAGISTDLAADGYTMKNMGGFSIWRAAYDVPTADLTSLEASNIWSQYDADYVLPNISLTADESYEVSSIKADMETYIQEYTLSVIVGSTDLDATWEEYLSRLNDMGVDKVVSIYQDALDRYMSK